jgi:hypothetical protein
VLLPVNDDRAFEVTPARAIEEPKSTTDSIPIDFEMRTPKLVSLNAPVPAVFEVRNPGSDRLSDLVIQVQMSDELHHEQGHVLRHRIASLSPGEVYRTRLTTTAVGNGTARLTSTLTSADDVHTNLEASVEIGKQPVKAAARRTAVAPRRFLCRP